MKIKYNILLAISMYAMGTSYSMAIEKMRLAHGSPEDTTIHRAALKFAEIVKQRTNGEIQISVFANSALGTETEILQKTKVNIIDFAKLGGSSLESAGADYKVFNLPFVFRDRNHYFKVLKSNVGESILSSTKDYGVIGLAYYDSGVRSFYGKNPIESPDDLNGAKIRVMQNPTTIKMIQTLGGTPVAMPWGEAYSAIKMGLVDMAENNILALTSGKHGELIKFYSDTEQQMVPDVLVISESRWKSLTMPQQGIIKQAAIESSEYQMRLWADEEKIEKSKAEKMGVKFTHAKRQLFINKVKPMIDAARKDPSIAKILDQISAL